ncbi:short-chain dehydrogenase [Candidatus Endobugula sertula]|uniref:Short-chain dehydrogenase n=1 Tax=Candidatus Endobugula sertula TaxID=62101 RepID=A0A1D2QLW1_9GAMM|nr:short-chain dehydrogenase [Candidatus Endobugula sertula]
MLDDKTAIITGGANGIGKATAKLFAEEGANVVIVDVDRISGNQVVEEIKKINPSVYFICSDVTLSQECKWIACDVINRFKNIDILFNNVGITHRATVLDTSEQEWDRVMDVNVRSFFLMSKCVIPIMQTAGGGVIVNVASGWGLVGGSKAVSYCASKGAVVLLTKAMALDHGVDNIRINCICPGDTDTNLLRTEAMQLGEPENALVEASMQRPLQRIGKPEEIAQAVLFLASPCSSFMTGEAMVVDGGGLAGSQ